MMPEAKEIPKFILKYSNNSVEEYD